MLKLVLVAGDHPLVLDALGLGAGPQQVGDFIDQDREIDRLAGEFWQMFQARDGQHVLDVMVEDVDLFAEALRHCLIYASGHAGIASSISSIRRMVSRRATTTR